MVDSLSRRAAEANHSSGRDVTTPAPTIHRLKPMSFKNRDLPVPIRNRIYPSAGIIRIKVSINSPGMGDT